MKRILSISAASLAIGALVIVSCQKNNTDAHEKLSTQISKKSSSDFSHFIRFPDGTSLIDANPGVDFVLPPTHEVVAVDQNNMLMQSDGGSITCTCESSSSGGCDPFKAGSKYGCINEECNDCDGKTKVADLSDNLVLVSSADFVIRTIDPGTEIDLFETVDEFMAAPAFNDILLRLPEVTDRINEIYEQIYPGGVPAFITDDNINSIPSTYKRLAINLFGTAAFFIVPDTYGNQGLYISSDAGAGGITCDCKSGNSGCTKKKRFGVDYCSSGSCNSCNLDGIYKLQGVEYDVQYIDGYVYEMLPME